MSKFKGRLSEKALSDKTSAQQQIRNWAPGHEFLCCFDVDGHLLDNMTAKQVIVFQPHFMDVFGLRDIETFYRLHAEHHNLWGKDRGCDRHEAQSMSLGSLLDDPELKPLLAPALSDKVKGIKVSLDGYIGHIQSTGKAYGIDSLLKYQQAHPGDLNLTFLVAWSKASDLTFPFATIPMPPFPNVRETLEHVAGRADVLIVSKTPYIDICNWLEYHKLIDLVTAVAGKEQGGKDEHICLAMGGEYDAGRKKIVKTGTKYSPANVIMGGDGGGDMKAAGKNGAFFFPTPPGREEQAWAEAVKDVFDPFFQGSYAGIEQEKIKVFESAMAPRGPWAETGYRHEEAYRRLQPKRQQLYARLNPGGKLAVL